MSTAVVDESTFYGLGRDFTSTTRLYLQHWMWRRQLKYLLHPAVTGDKEIMSVADIGCGTGIWLIDLAEQLPRAKLDGYDISSAQFPPAEWLPSNVELTTLNALAEIPSILLEKYDVIHIGLLVLVAGDEPVPLLKNVVKMLKPDGYLQWDEADLGGLYRSTIQPSVAKHNLDALYALLNQRYNRAGLSYGWVRSLDEILPQAGLEVVHNLFHPIPDEIAHPWTHMHLLSVSELIKDIKDAGDKVHEWWELYVKAIEEAREGASIRMGMVVAVGKKPKS